MLTRLRQLRPTHLRALAVALLATVFSAGLAFASPPPLPDAAASGLANAAVHAAKVVPVRVGLQDETTVEDEETETEEDTEEETETEEESLEEAGENCATDPTTLTDEELAEMRHGSIVCWAAHQETWPEEFKNHGQWVSSWAKWKAPTEDAEAGATAVHGKGKAKGHANKP
ncbi:MAG: hypothetical protein FIA92_05705 [Chloroflexi bacterium]|nr:hypothetical protein [Chloroflexota bacterium]